MNNIPFFSMISMKFDEKSINFEGPRSPKSVSKVAPETPSQLATRGYRKVVGEQRALFALRGGAVLTFAQRRLKTDSAMQSGFH